MGEAEIDDLAGGGGRRSGSNGLHHVEKVTQVVYVEDINKEGIDDDRGFDLFPGRQYSTSGGADGQLSSAQPRSAQLSSSPAVSQLVMPAIQIHPFLTVQ